MNILVLNAGSSSLKFSVFRMDRLRPVDEDEDVLARGKIERIGHADSTLELELGGQREVTEAVGAESIDSAVSGLLHRLESVQIDAVGHRIVHGGPTFFEPTLIDDSLLTQLRSLTDLAPLHNPSGVAGIETVRQAHPNLPNFAVFDTAFHHRLPAVAKTYALPRELSRRLELRRYGFHGISYSYVSQRLKLLVPEDSSRHIICHLGNGASVCALLDGASIDTSMGFTPMEGLIMGTRSGDVDPGLLMHLQRSQGFSLEQLDDLLNHQSGLLGISGTSGDFRDLEGRDDEASSFAIECFAYRVSKYIGAYAAALGGVDALVFTGGIGELSAGLRSRVCARLGFLGLTINEEANRRKSSSQYALIGGSQGKQVWALTTDEEREIARQLFPFLQ